MNIHMVWLGSEPNQKIIEHTQKLNPECVVKVWTSAKDLLPKEWEYTYYNYANAYQLKSDLLRLCALRKYGGLYIDFDCVMKISAKEIVKDWDTLVIPAMCKSSILPGNILYCPIDWPYWNYVDDYVLNYKNSQTNILTFDHFLYVSLPSFTYTINNDCIKFPSEIKYITDQA